MRSTRNRTSRAVTGLVALAAAFAATLAFASPAAAGADLDAGGTFVDDNGNIHEPYIEAAFNNNVTLGCDQARRLYCPNDSVTRGQMAAFISRAFLFGAPVPPVDYFTDDNGSIFENDINKIAAAGITLGCTATTYCPEQIVTRGQMASYLARAAGLPAAGQDYFIDDEGSVHEADINRIAEQGITRGCTATNDRYCPERRIPRDEMATLISRTRGYPPIYPPPAPTPTPPIPVVTVADINSGRVADGTRVVLIGEALSSSGDEYQFSDGTGTVTVDVNTSQVPSLPLRTCVAITGEWDSSGREVETDGAALCSGFATQDADGEGAG